MPPSSSSLQQQQQPPPPPPPPPSSSLLPYSKSESVVVAERVAQAQASSSLDLTRLVTHYPPTHVLVTVLGEAQFSRSTSLLGVARVRCSFTIEAELARLFSPKGVFRVHARLVLANSNAQWSWTNQLQVNALAVDLTPNVRKLRVKQFAAPFLSPMPADVTMLLHAGVNHLTFQPSTPSEFGAVCVTFDVVKGVSDLVASVVTDSKQIGLSVANLEQLAQRNASAAADDEDDVAEAAFIVSLSDPLTLARIATPARSRLCSHLQCFDLTTYIEFSLREQYWHCPVCAKAAPFNQLIVDSVFKKMLVACANLRDEKVIIERDGSFSRLPTEGDDDTSSDSSGAEARPAGAKATAKNPSAVRDMIKSSTAVVISLDDDDDDDDDDVVVDSTNNKGAGAGAQIVEPPREPTALPPRPAQPIAPVLVMATGAATSVVDTSVALAFHALPTVPQRPDLPRSMPPLPPAKKVRTAIPDSADVIVLDSDD
jgi:hypothetical protein